MFAQLQRVGDEFGIDQSPAQQFDVQHALGRLMRGHLVAHLLNLGGDLGLVAFGPQNAADDRAQFGPRRF
jgi:hypothetical protein